MVLENLYLGNFSPHGVSSDTNLPSSQFVKTIKTASGHCIRLVNKIINSENTPKEIMKSFTDYGKHDKKTDGWKPATICWTGVWKTVPHTRGGGRGGESIKLHRVGAGEPSTSTATDTNTSFVTSSTTKQMIAEIWEKKNFLLPVNLLFFPWKTE